MTDWVLSVDFGTSNTAAAYRRAGERAQVVRLSSNADQMPSSVIRLATGPRVGDAARNAMLTAPDCFVDAPKALVGQGTVLLGTGEVKVVDLVADVLRTVVEKATRVAGGSPPTGVVLTHPQAWGRSRLDVLRQAWDQVGGEQEPRLVSEPVAAVSRLALTAGAPPGSRVAVLDYGGGTCDVAVLEVTGRPGDPLRVLAHDGDPELGGRALDQLLHRWVLDQLPSQVRQALDEDLASSRTLLDQVRRAKEDLSDHEYSDVAGQGLKNGGIQVTRLEFDRLVAPEVAKVSGLVTSVLAQADVEPGQLQALHLTGGSSAVRAVVRAMTELLGGRPATLDDPKLVVALGAHDAPLVRTRLAPTPGPNPPPGRQVRGSVPLLLNLSSVRDVHDLHQPTQVTRWLVPPGRHVPEGEPLATLEPAPFHADDDLLAAPGAGTLEQVLVPVGRPFTLAEPLALFRPDSRGNLSEWPGSLPDRSMGRLSAQQTRVWTALRDRWPLGIWRGLVTTPPGATGISRLTLAHPQRNQVTLVNCRTQLPVSGTGFCWETWVHTGSSLPPFLLLLRAGWYEGPGPTVVVLTPDGTTRLWHFEDRAMWGLVHQHDVLFVQTGGPLLRLELPEKARLIPQVVPFLTQVLLSHR